MNYATQSFVPAGTTVCIQLQDQSKPLYFNSEGRENGRAKLSLM